MKPKKTIRQRFKNVTEEARSYYSLFGVHGLALVAKSRILKRQIQVALSIPSFPHRLYLRLRTSDVALFSEVILGSQYEWDYCRLPETIVDVGANIGLASVFYTLKYPRARIFAIEPEQSNFELLVKNTAPYPNITPVRAALWQRDCELNLFDPGEGLWGYRTRELGASQLPKSNLVRGLTMDTFMKTYNISYIDLLKIDIEGSEKEVFEHPSTWINRVGAIAIELHDRFKSGCSDCVSRATKDFQEKFCHGETTFILRQSGEGELLNRQPSASERGEQHSHLHRGLRPPIKIEYAS